MSDHQTIVPLRPTPQMIQRMAGMMRQQGLTSNVLGNRLDDGDITQIAHDLWAEAIYASPNGGRPA